MGIQPDRARIRALPSSLRCCGRVPGVPSNPPPHAAAANGARGDGEMEKMNGLWTVSHKNRLFFVVFRSHLGMQAVAIRMQEDHEHRATAATST